MALLLLLLAATRADDCATTPTKPQKEVEAYLRALYPSTQRIENAVAAFEVPGAVLTETDARQGAHSPLAADAAAASVSHNSCRRFILMPCFVAGQPFRCLTARCAHCFLTQSPAPAP